MKRASILVAVTSALLAAAAFGSLAEADQQVKHMVVRNAAEVKSVFALATADGGRQAVEISCSPAGSTWCAGGFITACDRAKGGMSTGPNGEVTCSLPQHD